MVKRFSLMPKNHNRCRHGNILSLAYWSRSGWFVRKICTNWNDHKFTRSHRWSSRAGTNGPHQAKEHDMRAFARGSVAHLSLSFWANMFSVQLNCCHKMPLLWCVIADALSTKQNTANPHTVLCGIQTHVRAQCTLHSVHSAHTNITTKQRTQLKTNATNYFNEAQFFPLLCASTSAF